MSLWARGLVTTLFGAFLVASDYLLNRFGGSLLIPTFGRVGGEVIIVAVLLAGFGLIVLGIAQAVRGLRQQPRQIEPPVPIAN
jgi:hypothetical protein